LWHAKKQKARSFERLGTKWQVHFS